MLELAGATEIEPTELVVVIRGPSHLGGLRQNREGQARKSEHGCFALLVFHNQGKYTVKM